MKLPQLLNDVKTLQVTGNAEEVEINKLIINSQEAELNSIFFAIKGYKTDGHKFILDAINKGASAIVLDNNDAVPPEIFDKSNVVKIVVENSRKALSKFANVLYDKPSQNLNVYGITGTKGKSTTAFYLKSIIEAGGDICGLIGTISNYIGTEEWKSRLTTPEANEINQMFDAMLKKGIKNSVMEVSSHSLYLHRVDDIDFDSVIFTNIASDHLDFHKTFENYFAAKKMLFDNLNLEAKAIYNIDDPNGQKIVNDVKTKKYSFGVDETADFRVEGIEYDFEGTRFTITHNKQSFQVNTKLIGLFNAYNSTAALAAAMTKGIPLEQTLEGIKNTPQVPGRFELIEHDDKKIIVDYAHNASSLDQVLKSIKHINQEKRPVHTVFGCGGDRDKTKRPVMGKIADELSTVIYVTSDNPRTENPSSIIDDIVTGIKRSDYRRIDDREEAIKTAIQNSEDNAIVLIAGKGHETYQEINGVRSFFSDRETIKKYLN